MNKCIKCKFFEYSTTFKGTKYGYCNELSCETPMTDIDIETDYPEFIKSVVFVVTGDFGCALWQEAGDAEGAWQEWRNE